MSPSLSALVSGPKHEPAWPAGWPTASAGGRDAAKRNRRDVIVPQDLPITKGVPERMREFGKLDEAQDSRNLLSQVVRRPRRT